MKEQTLIPGILTEEDVIRRYLSKQGKRLGSIKTAKKSASSAANARKATAVRMAKQAAKKAGKGAGL